MNTPKYSIVMPVYLRESEHKTQVEETIESFRKVYSPEEAELIIVDDGSTMPSGFLKDKADTYVRQPNQGISRSWNVGLWLARADYVLVANDDILIAPGLLEALSKGFENEKAGVVAPQSGGPHVVPGSEDGEYVENHKFYPGYCFMLKKDRFYEDFDNQFRTNCGDVDYWARIRNAGFDTMRAPVSVWHKEGGVLHGMDYSKITSSSLELFNKKHGFDPIAEYYS